ncbi:hypothetical protein [Caballeronia sp. LZ034LL]|uniref:hypothetical protein n=1 Tax=Caballeronia sp. LZ034LL TaxID=3038567 RepID=UPI00285CC287|nr:hypothetical protein [Caballeronia sp. LZ034LL]MDR5839362.1 hypothetical protein [Caballeronia sp. LZ034LL]
MANPFEAARPYLWNGSNGVKYSEKYICHAIGRAEKARRITAHQALWAINMIHLRLGEHRTVEGWLCNEGGVRLGEMSCEQVQLYRFLWLDELSRIWNQGERA